MQPYRRFHPQYRERLALADGTWAELRMVRPEDAALLQDGFERLSPSSRFQRFLSAKPRLSQEELHYLTRVDGERHLAIGAVTRSPGGREVGLGVARFIRLSHAPEIAEVAITVVDDAQGKGLGRVLMDRLVAALARLPCSTTVRKIRMSRSLRRRTSCSTVAMETVAIRLP